MQLVTLDINVTADHVILWHDDALHLLDQQGTAADGTFRALHGCRRHRRGDPRHGGAPAIGITAAYGVAQGLHQEDRTMNRDHSQRTRSSDPALLPRRAVARGHHYNRPVQRVNARPLLKQDDVI